MPKNQTIITVFVASPSDVKDERNALDSVISELNRTWSENLNLRLDLIKWETDTYPSFGSYPQDVINTQINDDYDIFIAIFSGKIGSPTPEYESGTLEEFYRAYKRHQENGESIDLMIYFKDQSVQPSKIDAGQLIKIKSLQKEFGDKGGLYCTFKDIKNFESLLRIHLSKVAQKWSAKIKHESNKPQKITTESNFNQGEVSLIIENKESDYGLLDYIEIYEDRTFNMTSSLTSIAEATEKIGQQFNRRNDEMNILNDGTEKVDQKKVRKILKMLSDDMESFSETLEPQTKIMSKSREESLDALSKALSMYVDFNDNENYPLVNIKGGLNLMKEYGNKRIKNLQTIKKLISGLPKLTSQLNKSKIKTVKSLDYLIEEINQTVQNCDNILLKINDIRDQCNRTNRSN